MRQHSQLSQQRPHGRLYNQCEAGYSDKKRRLCELGGLESIINPCARLHPGLGPGVGSSLEYECSVTQSPPVDYCYVKWCDGGPISRAEPIQGERPKVETLEWRLKAPLPCFRISPYFWFPDSILFRFLTVWPSSVIGEQKIQAIPGSALLRLSYTTSWSPI